MGATTKLYNNPADDPNSSFLNASGTTDKLFYNSSIGSGKIKPFTLSTYPTRIENKLYWWNEKTKSLELFPDDIYEDIDGIGPPPLIPIATVEELRRSGIRKDILDIVIEAEERRLREQSSKPNNKPVNIYKRKIIIRK